MAANREDLLRYGMDCQLRMDVEERLGKAGWEHHPEPEGAQCPCGGGVYAYPNRYWEKGKKLRCDACKRVVLAAESQTQTEGP